MHFPRKMDITILLLHPNFSCNANHQDIAIVNARAIGSVSFDSDSTKIGGAKDYKHLPGAAGFLVTFRVPG